jgi:hypothetical protein
MGWLRTAVGIALIAAPGVPMRLAGQRQPTGTELLLMRTIGIRDLVGRLGTVAAARSQDVGDVRRWPGRSSSGVYLALVGPGGDQPGRLMPWNGAYD